MTPHDYEQSMGRLVGQKGVRGVAVTSRDGWNPPNILFVSPHLCILFICSLFFPAGEVIYYNNGIPPKTVQAYTKVYLDSEYLCTVMARQNDPNTRVFYIRVETDNYEMVVSVGKPRLPSQPTLTARHQFFPLSRKYAPGLHVLRQSRVLQW